MLLVIGLDCVPPALAFERWADAMPNLSALRASGVSGPLRSTMPPITVPAWTCMVSGADPGELGLYGFRNRVLERGRPTYDLRLATSRDVRDAGVKRVWDRLGERGKKVAPLFVPLTSPPTPVRGVMASCFLHAGGPWTFPPALGPRLEAAHGAYRADVESFRDGDLPRIFEELHAMTDQHFAIARELWTTQRPDFLMMVEMGPDRLHHAAWRHLDPQAPGHDPAQPWGERARRYYAALDAELGRLVDHVRQDADVTVMVASDHGARAMEGGFAINELLAAHGWLTFEEGDGVAPLRDRVDWSRTRAWGEGGYYARVWLNVAGREPRGVVTASRQEEERRALEALLLAEGPPGTRVFRPDTLYRTTRGVPPDLMVAFGDLAWRSIGTVGHGKVHLAPAELGEDGCNHDWEGIVVVDGPGAPAAAPRRLLDLSSLMEGATDRRA